MSIYKQIHRKTRSFTPWYEKNGGARLQSDLSSINADYPSLTFDIAPETRRASLNGNIIHISSGCGVPTPVAVRVSFPPDYPQREPIAYEVEGRFPHLADRHFYSDGRCCLWLPPESLWMPEDANSLLGFLDQLAIFIDKQFVCDALSRDGVIRWPGPARAHGMAGYHEYSRDLLAGNDNLLAALAPILSGRVRLGPNEGCACGSGLKFKRCHKQTVITIEMSIGLEQARKIFKALDLKLYGEGDPTQPTS